MGGKTGTTTQTSTVSIPPDVLARYNAVNARAEDVASQPFTPYGGQFVAPLTPTQQAGISGVNQAAQIPGPYYQAATESLLGAQAQGAPYYGAATSSLLGAGQQAGPLQAAAAGNIAQAQYGAQPYQQVATGLGLAGAQGVMPGALTGQEIGQYMSPYLGAVAGTTMANLRQQQQEEQSKLLGQTIMSGAFGGDRGRIAAANLARQQELATGQTLAGIYNQGYGQALGTAQQQQAQTLAAQQANRAAVQQAAQQMAALGQQGFGQGITTAQQQAALAQQLYGQGATTAQQLAALGQGMYGMGAQTAQGLAGLGAQAQQAALTGAQAQLQAGAMQQQTEQAALQAQYNQFLQQQGYPFQVAQFLANIAMGTGALSGTTTSGVTTAPQSFFSDARLKRDVEPIGRTFDGQDIVRFKYKGEPGTRLGLIAQDVEKHHPEAVGLAGGYKTVDYDKATDAAARRGHFAAGGESSEGGAVLPGLAGLGFATGGTPDDSMASVRDMLERLASPHIGRYPYSKSGLYGQRSSGAGPYGTSLEAAAQRRLMTSQAPSAPQQASGMQEFNQAMATARNIGAAYDTGESAARWLQNNAGPWASRQIEGIQSALGGPSPGVTSVPPPGPVTQQDLPPTSPDSTAPTGDGGVLTDLGYADGGLVGHYADGGAPYDYSIFPDNRNEIVPRHFGIPGSQAPNIGQLQQQQQRQRESYRPPPAVQPPSPVAQVSQTAGAINNAYTLGNRAYTAGSRLFQPSTPATAPTQTAPIPQVTSEPLPPIQGPGSNIAPGGTAAPEQGLAAAETASKAGEAATAAGKISSGSALMGEPAAGAAGLAGGETAAGTAGLAGGETAAGTAGLAGGEAAAGAAAGEAAGAAGAAVGSEAAGAAAAAAAEEILPYLALLLLLKNGGAVKAPEDRKHKALGGGLPYDSYDSYVPTDAMVSEPHAKPQESKAPTPPKQPNIFDPPPPPGLGSANGGAINRHRYQTGGGPTIIESNEPYVLEGEQPIENPTTRQQPQPPQAAQQSSVGRAPPPVTPPEPAPAAAAPAPAPAALGAAREPVAEPPPVALGRPGPDRGLAVVERGLAALQQRRPPVATARPQQAGDALPEGYADYVFRGESRGRPDAVNPFFPVERGGPLGPSQAIRDTWLSYARANPDRFRDMSEEQILAARTNPDLSRDFTEWYGRQNMPILRAAGIEPTRENLRLAHMGAGNAVALLSRPNDLAVDALAAANGGSRERALAILRQNGGREDMTAQEFAARIISTSAGGAGQRQAGLTPQAESQPAASYERSRERGPDHGQLALAALAPPERERPDWMQRNQGWLVPVLSGLGAMASSPSRYLGSALLQGLAGGAQQYTTMQQRAEEQARRREQIGIQRAQAVLQAGQLGLAGEQEVRARQAFEAAIALNAYNQQSNTFRVYVNGRPTQVRASEFYRAVREGRPYELIPGAAPVAPAAAPRPAETAPVPPGAPVRTEALPPPVSAPATTEPVAPAAEPTAAPAAATAPAVAPPVYRQLPADLRPRLNELATSIEDTPRLMVTPPGQGEDPYPEVSANARLAQASIQQRNSLAQALSSLPTSGAFTPGQLTPTIASATAWVNSLLSSVGSRTSIAPEELATAEGAQKISRELAFALQRGSGSRAVAELTQALATVPTIANSPQGAANILSDILIGQQRDIDMNNFFVQAHEYLRHQGLNEIQLRHASRELANEFAQRQEANYGREREALRRLFMASERVTDPEGRVTTRRVLPYIVNNADNLSPEYISRIERTFGPDVLRYFTGR